MLPVEVLDLKTFGFCQIEVLQIYLFNNQVNKRYQLLLEMAVPISWLSNQKSAELRSNVTLILILWLIQCLFHLSQKQFEQISDFQMHIENRILKMCAVLEPKDPIL